MISFKGTVLPGILLIGTGYVTCENPYIAVGILCFAVGMSGFQYPGCMVNHVDIAPPFAGILFGISNTCATIPGVLAPYAIGRITAKVSVCGSRPAFQLNFTEYSLLNYTVALRSCHPLIAKTATEGITYVRINTGVVLLQLLLLLHVYLFGYNFPAQFEAILNLLPFFPQQTQGLVADRLLHHCGYLCCRSHLLYNLCSGRSAGVGTPLHAWRREAGGEGRERGRWCQTETTTQWCRGGKLPPRGTRNSTD